MCTRLATMSICVNKILAFPHSLCECEGQKVFASVLLYVLLFIYIVPRQWKGYSCLIGCCHLCSVSGDLFYIRFHSRASSACFDRILNTSGALISSRVCVCLMSAFAKEQKADLYAQAWAFVCQCVEVSCAGSEECRIGTV